MSQIKVSVVMPIFNVDSFLDKTLKDVSNQTLREIEIICVDDGSTDNSRQIIKNWQKVDSRIQLISQENQYAGAARNRGLKEAVGKYVIFWDSDDMFSPEALEKMYLQAEAEQADICVCAAQRYDTERETFISTSAYLDKNKLPEQRCFNKYDMPQYIFSFATNVPWNKLYKKEFVQKHQLQYQTIRQANDTFFTISALFYAERITYVEDVLVTYRINNSSSISGRASETVFCAFDSYVYTLEKLSSEKDFDLVKQCFLNRALGGFFHALNIQTSFDTYQMLYNMLVREGFARFGLDNCDEDYVYAAWMYREMKLMQKMSAADYLVYKNINRKLSTEQLKSDKAELKNKIASLKTEKEDFRKTVKALQKKYDKISNSKEYKLGRALLWLPRKVQSFKRQK